MTAGLVGLWGALFGTTLGQLPARDLLALYRQVGEFDADNVTLPWRERAIFVAGRPVTAFLLGLLPTRPRLPLVRRLE